jgi:hypothetical protein
MRASYRPGASAQFTERADTPPLLARVVLLFGKEAPMSTETIVIIVVLILLLGGGGFFWRGRR